MPHPNPKPFSEPPPCSIGQGQLILANVEQQRSAWVGGLVGRQSGRSGKEEAGPIGSFGESLPLCLSWEEALASVSPDKARNGSKKESLGAGKCVLDGVT